MATEINHATEQSATALVGGIIDDMQELIKQQVQLTRKEISDEIQKATMAARFYAVGWAVLSLGLLFLCFTLVHWLHWMASPAGSDFSQLPLWACHLIVGGPLTLIGATLGWAGREKLASINPLHNQATEALKENVKWATKRA